MIMMMMTYDNTDDDDYGADADYNSKTVYCPIWLSFKFGLMTSQPGDATATICAG
jgi:hypothetical protein